MHIAVWSLLQQPSFLDVDLELCAPQHYLLHVLQERVWPRSGVGIWWFWRLPGAWQHGLLLCDDHCQPQSWTRVCVMELACTFSHLGLDW